MIELRCVDPRVLGIAFHRNEDLSVQSKVKAARADLGSESTVLLKEDVEQLTALCAQLHRDSNSKTIVLIDKSGQYIASSGQVAELDLTSLASLTAGNMAATSGLAELIGEADFPNVFHEGQRESMHLLLGQ